MENFHHGFHRVADFFVTTELEVGELGVKVADVFELRIADGANAIRCITTAVAGGVDFRVAGPIERKQIEAIE